MSLPAAMLTAFEFLAVAAGVGYAVLAARRNRLCWIVGAVASALAGVLYAANALPMQAGLQVFYIGMSVYGWMGWTRNTHAGEMNVGVWPLRSHLIAAVILVVVSFATAQLLAASTRAAWPVLDSLTTWFSLLATWLAARGRLENWVYWIVIDGVLVFLSFMQGSTGLTLLNLMLVAIAAAGFIAWRRRLRAQAALAPAAA
jgi:nicotinamide mononucleotide transporter